VIHLDKTGNYQLQKPAIGKGETTTDLINAIASNADICEGQFTNVEDIIIEDGQAEGTDGLRGYQVYRHGFVFQWGRASVPPGAGARVTLPKASSTTIGVDADCISGMYLTYVPMDMMTGTTFNVATSSSKTEEIFWHSYGRI
jgi:hypothetical protein